MSIAATVAPHTGRKLPLSGSLYMKLALALGLVVLGDGLFWHGHTGGMAMGGYGVALILALIAARPAVRRDPRALLALGGAALAALAMAWNASPLAWSLFWLGAAMASLLPRTARFDDGWRWLQRLVVHTMAASVGALLDHVRVLKIRRQRQHARLSVTSVIRLIALPLFGSVVVLILFSAANPVIERFFETISLPGLDIESVARALLWVVLFTLSWSLLRPRIARRLLATFDGSGDLALPGVSVASILLSLAMFNLLFALQNVMDAAWLWGLAPLPENMTLAEYAHRGAYPLIATALFAGFFVLVFLRPGSTTAREPWIRRLVVLWIGQNLFLVASSALRTIDYVEAYSLTRLRIAALLWMGLVAVGLVLVLCRMLRSKSAGWLINANLAAAGLLLAVVSVVDLGAVAAQWNVRHAREVGGTGAQIDLCYLRWLGSPALLPLIELEQGDAPTDLRHRAGWVRRMVQYELADSIRSTGGSLVDRLRLQKAEARVSNVPDADVFGRRCDGQTLPPYVPAD